MGSMGRMAAKFFEPPSSSFQGGVHISHQASLLPEERGCNRPQCCFSKIIPSFFTIKEGSTFLTKPLFPQEREDVTALRCSEPLRSMVGGASKPCAILCGLGPHCYRWRPLVLVLLWFVIMELCNTDFFHPSLKTRRLEW